MSLHLQSIGWYLQTFRLLSTSRRSREANIQESRFALLSNLQVGMWWSSYSSILKCWISGFIELNILRNYLNGNRNGNKRIGQHLNND